MNTALDGAARGAVGGAAADAVAADLFGLGVGLPGADALALADGDADDVLDEAVASPLRDEPGRVVPPEDPVGLPEWPGS